jgi:hypothetical protein
MFSERDSWLPRRLQLAFLVALLCAWADRATPVVLRIGQFGLVVGLAITLWHGLRAAARWLHRLDGAPAHQR